MSQYATPPDQPVDSGHPDGLPELFLDRSLGRIQVPERLRAEGLRLRTLSEFYGIPADERIKDVEWLTMAGRNGLLVLMKDRAIRRRGVELEALVSNDVKAFCLSGADLTAEVMALRFLAHLDLMVGVAARPGPSLHVIGPAGVTSVALP